MMYNTVTRDFLVKVKALLSTWKELHKLQKSVLTFTSHTDRCNHHNLSHLARSTDKSKCIMPQIQTGCDRYLTRNHLHSTHGPWKGNNAMLQMGSSTVYKGQKVFNRGKKAAEISPLNDDGEADSAEVEEKLHVYDLAEETDGYILPENGHQVLIIQPDFKGPLRGRTSTDLKYKLSEAVALIHSLSKWHFVTQHEVIIRQLGRKEFFGPGSFEPVQEFVRRQRGITAVFVNVDMLSGLQLGILQRAWRLPVYDRFTIVLQIFKDHARTKEAKLQVALAEIPYFRSRLKGLHDGSLGHQKGALSHVGGSGETWIEMRRRILDGRERKLRAALENVKMKRDLLKKGRTKKGLPIVAVVGYTNAGKTSLIKTLTADAKIEPQDKLFATLDVTAHAGLLPSNMTAIYIDTVGFISNIPTSLIASFSATLDDIRNADAIVHVRDISHPDTEAQKANVLATLVTLRLPQHLMDNIIEIANKADLLTRNDNDSQGELYTSTITLEGIEQLKMCLEDGIITSTGRMKKVFKVAMAGDHLRWLYDNTTVVTTRESDSPEHILVHCILTQAQYDRFKAIFGPTRTKQKTNIK